MSAATSHPAIPKILQRAADALADAAWVMEGAKTELAGLQRITASL